MEKLIAASIIIAVTLVGGLLPIWVRSENRKLKLLIYGEAFARGVFIGAALLHLWPEAQEHFAMLSQEQSSFFTNSYLWVGLSLFGLIAIERFSKGLMQKGSVSSAQFSSYLLILLLSIHSIVAGAALGIATILSGFFIIFIAIVAHKGADAFVLAVSMQNQGLKQSTMYKVMLIFSLMTPLGMFGAAYIHNYLHSTSGLLLEGIIDSITAGTFIYIALFDHSCTQETKIKANKKVKLTYSLIGFCNMALVASII